MYNVTTVFKFPAESGHARIQGILNGKTKSARAAGISAAENPRTTSGRLAGNIAADSRLYSDWHVASGYTTTWIQVLRPEELWRTRKRK